MSKMMIQLSLTAPMAQGVRGIRTLTTWVESDSRLKQGAQITLKGDDDTFWTITKVYEGEHTLDEISNRGWDNNNYDKHDTRPIKERLS